MPQINISTLTGPELRQLLDASRRRGDAALSYQVLQEMAARREGRVERVSFKMPRPAKLRGAAGQHLVAVDLGDPMAADDLPPMPHWRPPPHVPEAAASPSPEPEPEADPELLPAPPPRASRRKKPPVAAAEAAPAQEIDAEPPPPMEADRPLSLRDADPGPVLDDDADHDLRLDPVAPKIPPPARRPRSASRGVAGFALGIGLGIALGWWAGRIDRDVLSPRTAPVAAPIQTAALEPPPAAVAPPPASPAASPAPEAQADVASGGAPPDLRSAAAAPPNAQEPAREADSTTTEPPAAAPAPAPVTRNAEPARTAETAQAASDRSAPVVAKGCAAAPTPADREICGDPELRRLQGELRKAYAAALDAHQDRTLLRQRQLAWREARNTVTDPDRLARLYEERIRRLNAAAAEARREH